MKRMTIRNSDWTVSQPTNLNWENVLYRLTAYEDTGLEPEEISDAVIAAKLMAKSKIVSCFGVDADHVRELVEAEQDGRLVVLDEPREPLVWGDDNRDTILCPNCNQDLMGGFPEANSCEAPMYQCPYCGQPIDGTKALTREEAEATLALKGGEG